MADISKISVVLPSLDPDEKLLAVIDGLLQYGFGDIILVNDGSKPENMHYFETAATHPEVHLLHHEVNRGKGAALKTAFAWCMENRPDCLGVVTVDGDNQHHPADTRACSEKMLETGSIVLGVRDFDQPDVPFKSRNGNKITSAVFKIFVNMIISDTQTGLRAIPANLLPLMNEIHGDRFEYETNMLLVMKDKELPFEEVKIRTVYIEENKSSHFRAFRDSWRIYKLILKFFFARIFRYAASSLICAGVDVVLYNIFFSILPLLLPRAIISTVIARAISSLLNFFLNRNLVFHAHGSWGSAICKYYALAIPQMLAQGLLNEGALLLFGIGDNPALRTLIYLAVMGVLFLVSYAIQQRWVFAPKKDK